MLDFNSAGALIPGAKLPEVNMETKTIKVLRKFYYNGKVQEIGQILTVSRVEAIGLEGTHKAVVVPDLPPKQEIPKEEPKKEEPKKEEPKAGSFRGKETSAETKKGGMKNDSI